MKKRGNRSIPDFSRAPKGPLRPKEVDGKPAAAPPPPTRAMKPHSTSQKSGRRGS